jgi:hypothetical protein
MHLQTRSTATSRTCASTIRGSCPGVLRLPGGVRWRGSRHGHPLQGAGGIGGLFERLFAPRVMRALYADELERLDAYAREHRPT